jgi:aminopeptidase N
MVYVDESVRRSGLPSDYEYLVAHEVAHQWWYGLVGNRTVDEPWLDEAHATYGSVIYRWHAGSPDAGERLVVNWIQDTGMRQPDDPPINSSALEFTNWSPYRDTVYIRGALFLHELRGQIGDEKFIELLRQFQETQRYKISTTNDYLRMAEELSGRDLDPLFEKWFVLGRVGVITYAPPGLVSQLLTALETSLDEQ